MYTVLHGLGPFSPPEKLRALIEELESKDAELHHDTIEDLKEYLAFAESLDVSDVALSNDVKPSFTITDHEPSCWADSANVTPRDPDYYPKSQ